MDIAHIAARQILDSRGNPTVEADVILSNGARGRAAVPSGASTGSGEALELRDGGAAYGGKSVEKAVGNVVDRIAPLMVGKDASNQAEIDNIMIVADGTPNKSGFGANAILAVSLAVAKAAAAAKDVPLYKHVGDLAGNSTFSLPMPMMNILNGGQHAAGSTDIQEFMVIPIGAADIANAVRMGAEVFHALKKVLSAKGYGTTVGDEGGYAPHVKNANREALDLIAEAITAAGYTIGTDFALALDVAASELVDGDPTTGQYNLEREGRKLSSAELVAWYQDLAKEFPIVSIEDGLGEQDWAGWQALTAAMGSTTQLVGDDLFVTNTTLLQRGLDEKAANAILIKLNQIGTLTETIQAVQLAQKNGWNSIISHRSGETEDTTIAHLAVGLNAGQIKTGSLSRTDRVAKYNELIRIAEDMPGAGLAKPF